MKLQEKKYLVGSFNPIQKLLEQKKTPMMQKVTSTHYYGEHKGNNVEKFVEYSDCFEAHILKESQGKYAMTEHTPIADKKAGMEWLKKRGFTTANIVKMDYTEYAYKNGTIGFYVINDFLNSVILNYPEGQHNQIEKEFGLQDAEVISVPYNKLLEQMGKLQSLRLS